MSSLRFLSRQTRRGKPCEALHSAHFLIQYVSSQRCQSISLSSPRSIDFAGMMNPAVLEQSAKRTVEGSRTQLDTMAGEILNILENRVPVPRFFRKADQDQKHGFGKRFVMAFDDMSHDAIISL
jgi:hypothetical protein